MRYIGILLWMLLLLLGCDAVGNFIDSVDYRSPVINSVAPFLKNVLSGDTVGVAADAENPENGTLTYSWAAPDGGQFLQPANQDTVFWLAPVSGGTYGITLTVSNDKKSTKASTQINVQNSSKPVVNILQPKAGQYFVQTDTMTVRAYVSHDNGLRAVRFYFAGKLISEQDYNSENSYSFKTSIDTNLVGKAFVVVWAEAFGQSGNTAADSIFINVEGILPGIKGN